MEKPGYVILLKSKAALVEGMQPFVVFYNEAYGENAVLSLLSEGVATTKGIFTAPSAKGTLNSYEAKLDEIRHGTLAEDEDQVGEENLAEVLDSVALLQRTSTFREHHVQAALVTNSCVPPTS